jgi:hypothetical protein
MIKYFGSNVELAIGDYVQVKGLLWGKRDGRIAYVPGISPAHKEFDTEECTHVGIRIGNGDVMGFPIFPGQTQVGKRVQFVKRCVDKYPGLNPDDPLY